MSLNCRSLAIALVAASALVCQSWSGPVARADDLAARTAHSTARWASALRATKTSQSVEKKNESTATAPATISLLDGLRSGKLAVDARGTGSGKMTLDITNRSRKPLRVVLPPGLVASGATGQFGGMGGNGNNMMGGMNGMGGNNNNNNNMGGMNGNNNMNSMSSNSSSNSNPSVLPATQGMIMIGQLITRIVEPGTWDTKSLTSMMSGMGGMGGNAGMGGMGGVGGGAGGGFRSLPPSDPPSAILRPNRTRRLPTQLVALAGPEPDGQVAMPAQGERLQLSEIGRINTDLWTQKVLRQLAEDQTPPNVAQLVLWHVSGGFAWETLDRMADEWTNLEERTLARQYVDRLRDKENQVDVPKTAVHLFWELTNLTGEHEAFMTNLRAQLASRTLLGLTSHEGIPTRPDGASLAFRMRLEPHGALVRVSSSDVDATAWLDLFELKLKLDGNDPAPQKAIRIADSLAEALLGRFLQVRLQPGPRSRGKATYQIGIRNESPLILNSVLVSGLDKTFESSPSKFAGLGLTPRRSVIIPVSPGLVERLKWRDGIRIVAANLSGL